MMMDGGGEGHGAATWPLCHVRFEVSNIFWGGGGREGGNGEIDGIGANSPDFNRPQMRFQFIDSF